MKLFLDDIRVPEVAFNYTKHPIFLEKDWVIVRDYDQFVDWITKNGLPDFIAFDHDLADIHYQIPNEDWGVHSSEQLGVEETGLDCAKWLIEYCMDNKQKLPGWFVHSMNPAGRVNIAKLLANFEKHQKKYGIE